MDFKQIMETYGEGLIRLSYYYVKDIYIAEDIVQEVFINFYENNNQYEEKGHLKAYLSKSVINRSKDYLRSWHYRKVAVSRKIQDVYSKTQWDHLVKLDEEALIGQAILELPVKYREVLIQYYFEDKIMREIADILDIPESTVKSRVKKAKSLLQQKLRSYEWEELIHE